ncbi:Translation elongation factor P Lys34:lysine transferase [Liberibacter crescens BT-1]|uniref:Translation elongation factor P Lys34:lysine transferase n=1 Tax=Liberibacter crescens (strain BT-1) TaxID=1215343 RepID=L0EUH1_LIBCB|nr:EF-P lysine aminoacylase EpmA [Liberibacter crescens]AGA64607.1 Translation elongation factor P Lys34:lysine transferase [Liberibacter crescens BT-1]
MYKSSDLCWWNPDIHLNRRLFLIERNKIKNSIRTYFIEKKFTEIDSSSLQVSPGNETHLQAFSTQIITADQQKKLFIYRVLQNFLVKSFWPLEKKKLFCFEHVWRNGEYSTIHHPEFTMLEWYRTEKSYEKLMDDCMDIIRIAAKTTQTKLFSFQGISCDPFKPPERIHVVDAFSRYANIDLVSTINNCGDVDQDLLALQAKKSGIHVANDDTWSDIFSRVLVEKIEPNLGIKCCSILDRYPMVEATLARTCPDDPRFSERFELYACGIELGNAFGELTDPIEQRCRFEKTMAEKKRIYKEIYPIDEDFLKCLPLIPSQTSGMAVGFDRLVMLATGASDIKKVLWSPLN